MLQNGIQGLGFFKLILRNGKMNHTDIQNKKKMEFLLNKTQPGEG
jgi:hypothetical protein